MTIYQERMLTILKHFIKVAEEQQYEWWADSGTLLGAIRHKGFIPWDTDIDIFVRRKDYNLILKYPELMAPYKIEQHCGFIKMYDDTSTGFIGAWKKGISIDLFPLDYYKEDRVAGLYWGFREKRCYPKEWYEGYELAPFEDIEVRIPVKAEDILTQDYGDWETPQKEGGSHSNADAYFSLKREW